MLSNRFLIVLVLSSAARIPLFLTTIACAIRASSPPFIIRISGSALTDLKNSKFIPIQGLALPGHGADATAGDPATPGGPANAGPWKGRQRVLKWSCMLRISKLTDYATVILAALAQDPE